MSNTSNFEDFLPAQGTIIEDKGAHSIPISPVTSKVIKEVTPEPRISDVQVESPQSSTLSPPSSPVPELSDEYLQGVLDGKVSLDPSRLPTTLEFQDYIEMMCLIDENIRSGAVKFSPWQIDTNNLICRTDFTLQNRLKYSVAAANGSGKDAYCISPFAIWFCSCLKRSRCIITTGSYTQMKNQTENYIRTRCEVANAYFKSKGCDDVFLIKLGHIVCTITRSEIIMFVTDEPGKAEGYHPFPDYPMGKLAIIINEGKTVPNNIYESLSRCSFTHWLEFSSTGEARGMFYDHVTNAVRFPATFEVGKRYTRIVTAYDCPHITRSEIEADKIEYGENSALFKSKRLSEFFTTGDSVVITLESMNKCLSLAKSLYPDVRIENHLRAGIDLSAGGDETCMYVFNNNKFVGRELFSFRDTTETCDLLISLLQKYGFTPKIAADFVFADDGGVGHGILDNMEKRGWAVTRRMNQSAPITKGMLRNRGAEMWFSFKRLVEECVVILPEDDVRLKHQLCNRFYGQSNDLGGIVLESKKQARAKGHGSPDRADAVVLAFSDLRLSDFLDGNTKSNGTIGEASTYNSREFKEHRRLHNQMTAREMAEALDNVRYNGFEGIDTRVGNRDTNHDPGELLRELCRETDKFNSENLTH